MNKTFLKKPGKKTTKVSDDETLQNINNKLEALGISKPQKPKYVQELAAGVNIIQTDPNQSTEEVCCFWCRYPTCQAVGIPLCFHKEKLKYVVEGSFCSFNCCLSYIHDSNSIKYRDSICLLSQLILKLKTRFTVIEPSKHWQLLIPYGGVLTKEQFKQNHITLNEGEYDEYKKIICPSKLTFFVK